MPVYGFPDRGSYDRTRDAVRKVNREFPATIRDPKAPKEPTPTRGPWIGKPATAFTEGLLTAPNNVVNLWLSDAHEDGPAVTDPLRTITAHKSTGDFATTDFVIVTQLSDGTRHVSCYPGGGG